MDLQRTVHPTLRDIQVRAEVSDSESVFTMAGWIDSPLVYLLSGHQV